MKILIGVDLALVIWIVSYYTHVLPLPEPTIYQYIAISLITIVQPAILFWTVKRNYDSNNHLGEPLEVQVLADEISLTGESFFTTIKWEKVFKVDEVIKYFLIYQNSLSAIIISKKHMTEAETEEFKRIINAHPDLTKNLK